MIHLYLIIDNSFIAFNATFVIASDFIQIVIIIFMLRHSFEWVLVVELISGNNFLHLFHIIGKENKGIFFPNLILGFNFLIADVM